MATASFDVEIELAGHGIPDKASFVLRAHPSWAPLGAARFKELVEAKFYDDTRFFRVLDGPCHCPSPLSLIERRVWRAHVSRFRGGAFVSR